MLNAAARVVTGTWKFDRGLGQTLHDELHWFDVPDRVFFKLAVTAVTVHPCLNGCAPQYLSMDSLIIASIRESMTCRTTASRPPVSTLGSTCVPPTVNYLQYLATGSTLTAVGSFQLPAPKSGTLSWISSGTRPSVQTASDVCLKRTCSHDTSAFSALEVLGDNRAV